MPNSLPPHPLYFPFKLLDQEVRIQSYRLLIAIFPHSAPTHVAHPPLRQTLCSLPFSLGHFQAAAILPASLSCPGLCRAPWCPPPSLPAHSQEQACWLGSWALLPTPGVSSPLPGFTVTNIDLPRAGSFPAISSPTFIHRRAQTPTPTTELLLPYRAGFPNTPVRSFRLKTLRMVLTAAFLCYL